MSIQDWAKYMPMLRSQLMAANGVFERSRGFVLARFGFLQQIPEPGLRAMIRTLIEPGGLSIPVVVGPSFIEVAKGILARGCSTRGPEIPVQDICPGETALPLRFCEVAKLV